MTLLILATLIALAQSPRGGVQRVQVFLDCSDCFADFIREETTFVDVVRDRNDADVHVMRVTGEGSDLAAPPRRDAGRDPAAAARAAEQL